MSGRTIVPSSVQTERLLLRCWAAEDARALQPVLEANTAHLGPWIPARVWTPAPIPVLEERLAGFAASFEAAREWRYGLFTVEDHQLVGEVDLFPRNAEGRVPFTDSADRIELGYWVRADMTGRGFATEASRAALAIATALPGLTHVEIRCDARNLASAAVPRRLGFTLASTELEPAPRPSEPPTALQVWVLRF